MLLIGLIISKVNSENWSLYKYQFNVVFLLLFFFQLKSPRTTIWEKSRFLKINKIKVQSICGKQISSILYLKGKIGLKIVIHKIEENSISVICAQGSTQRLLWMTIHLVQILIIKLSDRCIQWPKGKQINLFLFDSCMQSRSSLYAEYARCVGPPKHQRAPLLSKMF